MGPTGPVGVRGVGPVRPVGVGPVGPVGVKGVGPVGPRVEPSPVGIAVLGEPGTKMRACKYEQLI